MIAGPRGDYNVQIRIQERVVYRFAPASSISITIASRFPRGRRFVLVRITPWRPVAVKHEEGVWFQVLTP